MLIVQKHLQAVTEALTGKKVASIGELLDKINSLNNEIKRLDTELKAKDVIIAKINNHPTVKPLKLMEYLCRLTKTPTGGLVLDPFGGSGSTALACINTGRKYLIIEKDPHYCEIARARVKQGGLFE
jgi:DNA modification methylase